MTRKFTFLMTAMALILAIMGPRSVAWGQTTQTWSYEVIQNSPTLFTGSPATVNGATWSIVMGEVVGSPTTNGAPTKYSGIYGWKWGDSSSKYYKSYTLSTDYFTDKNVKSVTVNFLNNGKKTGTMTVTQGSTTIGTASEEFGTTWTNLTANTTKGSGGTLSINYAVAQASYIHSIIVEYEEGTPSTDPSITVNPTTITWNDSPINVELSETISVSQANLAEGITVSSTIGTVTPSTIAVGEDATDVTFTYTPTSVGDFEGEITFTSGETTATVSVTGSAYDPSQVDTYELFTGELVEGDYVIYYDGYAMNNTVSSDRLQYEEVTVTDNKITNPANSIVWHIAPSDSYWTIFNAAVEKYAASTGKKNEAALLTNGTDDESLWTASGSTTHEFVNKKNATNNVNKNLRKNGTYGFACYATSTGGALTLYKKASAVATPTFTPSAGTYTEAQNVSIVCATEGATIYYTLDGTEPSNSSTLYTETINISETTTIKAIAYLNGEASDIATAEYEIVELYDIYCMSLPVGCGSVTTSPAQKAAEGTEVTITVTPAEHYSLTPNSLTVTGESSTTVNVNPVPGTVGEYTFVMPAEDVTIMATFTPVASYTVTIAENIQHGEVTSVENEYYEGATVQLTVEPDPNYGLVSLTIIKTQGGSATGIKPVLNAGNGKYEFAMPAYDITVRATFGQDFYTRVNNVANLVPGKHYIIVGKKNGTYYAMGGQNGNNRAAVEIEVTETTVQVPASSMHEFNISGDETNNYTFYELGPGFLYAASSSSNYLRTEETLDDNGKWTIEIDEETGEATIKAQGDNSRNMMRFNSSSELFSCYSSGQQPVYLYMKENDIIINSIYSDTYIDGDISGCLTFAVNNGAVLTVTGTIDENILMFSITDGSQLIYDNDIPNGTMVNRFRKYDDNEADQRTAWNLVSVPVKNFHLLPKPGISISGDYDLYSYSEPTHFWKNKKNEAILYEGSYYIPTAIGTGYLFSMPSSNTTGRFGGMGTLQGSGQDLSFPLSYTETLADGKPNVLKGFNLVGNPFTCNAYVNKDYLVLNETGSNFVNPTSPIKPGDAILVQATAEGQEITFTRDAPTEPENRLDISISQNRGSIIDNARIRFGEGRGMNKFYLNENSTRLYIPQNGKDYAVVMASAAEGEMPVNFKAEKNGSYTITVNTENIDAEYLHLIDNKTGMDTDLLSTPSYTFEAKTSDYASRFKLVFGVNNTASENSDGNFAFMSDGNLVIDNIEGEATLQIADELGRIISTETVSGSYNKALNLKAGLYILNLNGMTQKIVVK